jgi:hypothetical protein
VSRLLPKISNRTGCLSIIALAAIVIVILFVIGIHAIPGNELAETIQTTPS